MKDTINIVVATDDIYIQYLGVMLFSLLENNRDSSLKIFIFVNYYAYRDDSNFIKINKLLEKYNCLYEWLYIEEVKFKDFIISGHITSASYSRLFVHEIIKDTSVKKILYLDIDTIINSSIKDLWSISLKNYILGAVSEKIHLNIDINTPPNEKYFNAGVLLINLELWRKEAIYEHLIDTFNRIKDNIVYWDQDILNCFFNGNYLELDSKYNAMTSMLDKTQPNVEPVIIHFTGNLKPWHLWGNTMKCSSIYEKYQNKSPWKKKVTKKLYFSFKRALIHIKNPVRKISEMSFTKSKVNETRK